MCETLAHHDFAIPVSEPKPESKFWTQIDRENEQRYSAYLRDLPFTEHSLIAGADLLYRELTALIFSQYRETGVKPSKIKSLVSLEDSRFTNAYEFQSANVKIPKEFRSFSPEFISLDPYKLITRTKGFNLDGRDLLGYPIEIPDYREKVTYFSKKTFDELAAADGLKFVQRPKLIVVDKHIKVTYNRKFTP